MLHVLTLADRALKTQLASWLQGRGFRDVPLEASAEQMVAWAGEEAKRRELARDGELLCRLPQCT